MNRVSPSTFGPSRQIDLTLASIAEKRRNQSVEGRQACSDQSPDQGKNQVCQHIELVRSFRRFQFSYLSSRKNFGTKAGVLFITMTTNEHLAAPQTPKSLASEYSYVDVTVPSRSNHESASVEATLSNDTETRPLSSTPHRRAMVAKPATLPSRMAESAGIQDSGAEGTGDKRKVGRSDVANIFKASATIETVNTEQIQRIEEMRERIVEGATFNFNYSCLLLIASLVAGMGLISDSSTIVVSSMLLSPIMGPVLGMAYSIIVWDWALFRQSVKNEIISLIICIIIGMIVCLTTGWTNLAHDTWPTNEMSSRGELTNLLVGIPVAFLSGLGVAISVLDDSTSSLVGVAVSASLLPPAVNAGLTWLYSFVLQFEIADTDRGDEMREHEFAKMGGMSLALTVSNIVLVAISSALMFRVKEVLPVKKKVFWNDLGTARKINQKRALMEEILSWENDKENDSGDDV